MTASSQRVIGKLVIGLVLGSVVACFDQRRTPCKYMIPEDYVGWVKVYYEVSDAPALEMENDYLVFRFPESGVLYTSSSPEFGWAEDRHYYYSSGGAHQFPELGMIWGGYMGSSSTHDGNTVEVTSVHQGFFVGTEEQFMSLDSDSDQPGPLGWGPDI